jgi:hypothetical protein
MGIIKRLFGKADGPSENGKGLTDLAFVLLTESRLPDGEEIARVYRSFAAPGETLEIETDAVEAGGTKEILSFALNTGEKSFVALMPVAVPKGEADEGARFSVSSFRNQWKLPSHCAHLLVTLHASADTPRLVQLSRFTSLVAAITKSSPAVGVYWGNAGATHDSDFFVSVASDQGVAPRMMLWSGVSIARERDGRVSLLSLGMKQLNLPDLLLVSGNSGANAAMAMMFDLLAYVAQRGEALPDGHTVGRSANEGLRVRYVPSPLDSAKKVWRVELP